MTKINDINGAAMQPLRSVKKQPVSQPFTSKLKDSKLKQTSEEIVSTLLSSVKTSDEYTLKLHSKMSDVVLGRIASLKAQTDVSQEDLLALKDDITANIQKTGLPDKLKQELQTSVSAAVNSTAPSDDSSKVIEELKKLDSELSKDQEQAEPAEKPPEDLSSDNDQLSKIKDLKDAFSQQMAKMNEIPNAVNGKISKPFSQLNTTISKLSKKIEPQLQKQSEFVGKQLGSVQDSIAKKTESISRGFEEMKTTAVDGMKSKEEKMQKSVLKLNPLKLLMPKKDKDAEKFEKYKRSFIPDFMKSTYSFAKDQTQFILDVLKRNVKSIHKALKKTIDSVATMLVTKIAKSVTKILYQLSKQLGEMLYEIVSGIMSGLFAPFKPIIYAVSIALGLIMAAVTMALFKFPELAKPIAESLAKLAGMLAELSAWLIKEVWSWVSETLWPFLKDQVWSFIKNELWDFVSTRLWPIIDQIYSWLWEEFVPFLCTEFWPFVMEQVDKIFDWLEQDFMPFVFETFSWFRTKIIDPVWKEFVLPLLEKFVKTFMPWIEKHVFPVIGTILGILGEFFEAMKPWLDPLFNKMFRLVDWVLGMLGKIFTLLKPALDSLVKCIKDLFVGVFQLLKDVVIGTVEFVELFIKAFKQAWNNLCDYFATACIELYIPESVPLVGGKHLFGPYYPLSSMAGMKFDNSGGAGAPAPAPMDDATADLNADKVALENLDSYIDSAYGRIFHNLGILAKLLGINVSDSPALKPLSAAGFFSGTKKLREVDASAKLERYGGNPISKISQLVDQIAAFLDKHISPTISKLAKATGHEDLAIEVKADKAAEDSAKEIEGASVGEESKQSVEFDTSTFVSELFSDSKEEAPKTDDDNAFSFLANRVFPYMKDIISPLVNEIHDLAGSAKSSNSQVVNIVECSHHEELNYALVDQ